VRKGSGQAFAGHCWGQFGPLENLQRTLADNVTVIGVLSWTRGDGASITREHATRYGVTFPLLHDGPIAAMNT